MYDELHGRVEGSYDYVNSAVAKVVEEQDVMIK